MRILVGLQLFLALSAPCVAWAGQSASPQTPKPQPQIDSQPGPTRLAMAQPLTPQRLVSNWSSGSPPATIRTRPVVAADPPTLCETAVTTAEYVSRLPSRLLGAISLTESGRVDPVSGRVRPWPWTINAEGKGRFFDTKQEAIAAVRLLQSQGVQSIDVGCLQVNLMYHPDAFASLDDAFDPRGNANYAARFLNALYADGRGWPAAVAAYHSETPGLGDAYRVLVMARWQDGDTRAVVTGPVAYGDFAQADKAYGDKVYGGKAYGNKAYDDHAYGAFAPSSRVYGAFAPR
jgi:hypothetical protein